jgi:lipopolysaccharide transport system ATP-binding protein
MSKLEDDIAIKVEQVSKKYCKRLRHTMLYGVADIARSTLGLPPRSDRLRQGEFWAVNDVSFEVKRGETLGIIGPNGAGKTTILKLLNGIFMPDKGEIRIKGRVGALIEVGAGFHPMLTGRENVYINGSILGMSKKEIDERFDAIVDFADIGDFIDSPVKHYSSGMYVRLGFAVAVHSEPDILLVDEVLAVGDIRFQTKCFNKMNDFKDERKTIILVTHSMGAIQRHSDRVILLNKGSMCSIDTPKNVVGRYLALLSSDSKNSITIPDEFKRLLEENYDLCPQRANYNKDEFRYGEGGAQIIDFEVLNSDGEETTHIKSGETVLFRVKIKFYRSVEEPASGVIIRAKDRVEIYEVNTLHKGINIKSQVKGDELWVEHRINFSLPPGDYFFTAAVAEIFRNEIINMDWRDNMAHITVLPTDSTPGSMDAGISVFYESKDVTASKRTR